MECIIQIILQMVQAASFSHARRAFQKQTLDVIQIGLEVVEVAASIHLFVSLCLNELRAAKLSDDHCRRSRAQSELLN